MFIALEGGGAMQLSRLLQAILGISLLSALVLIRVTTAEATIENVVDANISIEMNSATDFKIKISLDVVKAVAFGVEYGKSEIAGLMISTNEDDIEARAIIKNYLHESLANQINKTFRNANVCTTYKKPNYVNSVFYEEYDVNLTATFFGMNTTANAHNFVNGVLDMGAQVSYTFNLYADAGWTNTFTYILSSSMGLVSANPDIPPDNNRMSWTVQNRAGDGGNKQAKLSIRLKTPTTQAQTIEDISLEFELDARNTRSVSLKTNILAKVIDI